MLCLFSIDVLLTSSSVPGPSGRSPCRRRGRGSRTTPPPTGKWWSPPVPEAPQRTVAQRTVTSSSAKPSADFAVNLRPMIQRHRRSSGRLALIRFTLDLLELEKDLIFKPTKSESSRVPTTNRTVTSPSTPLEDHLLYHHTTCPRYSTMFFTSSTTHVSSYLSIHDIENADTVFIYHPQNLIWPEPEI